MSSDISENSYFQNILQVPCLRRTFLYGISGGVGAGLLHFLLTSNAPKSGHVGFWSYIGLSICFWTHCRFTTNVQELQGRIFKAKLEEALLLEGTDVKYRDTSTLNIDKPKDA